MKFLDKARVRFNEISNDVQDYLVQRYNQSRTVFTRASPFTHINEVLNDLFQLTLFYTEDSISELNVLEAERDESIYSLARLSGHDPFLGQASRGKIQLQLKTDATTNITGSFLIIPSRSTIKVQQNNLIYTTVLERDLRIDTGSRELLTINIQQGEYVDQTFVSNGLKLQSFNVKTKRNYFIDETEIYVYVNGEEWTLYDSIYDIPRNAKGLVVRTGVGGGLDLFFGNEYFGEIPPNGSVIRVEYLEHVGSSGNIQQTGNSTIKLEWDSEGRDTLGGEVDLNEVLDTTLETNIAFGSDAEDQDFTKLLISSAPKANVLANPENYIYFLERLNYFAYVDAYTTFDDEFLDDDNVIYIYAIPDILKKLTTDNNYFTTDINNFYLDEQEKRRVLSSIASSGKQGLGTELQFVIPEVRRYIMNIYVTLFEEENSDTDFDKIRQDMLNVLSKYFLYIKRRDRIPKSDIIRLLEKVPGVDSIDNLEFLSEQNETAIRNGFYINRNFQGRELVEEKIIVEEGTDPNLGLDNTGNIKIQRNELPLIRGEFYDRNGQYYEETPQRNKRSSVNILVSGTTKRDGYIDILQKRIKDIESGDL